MFFKVLVMSVILFCFCFWHDQHIHSLIPHTHICQDKIVSVIPDTPAYQYGQKKKVEGNWLRKRIRKKSTQCKPAATQNQKSYAKHMGVCINEIGLFWFMFYSQVVHLKCLKPFVKTVFASSLWHSTSSGLVVSLFFLVFFKEKRGNQRKNEEIQRREKKEKKRNGWKGTVRLTIAVSPVISQPVAHFLVDGGHGLHVGLPPLPPQVLGLQLQQLQHVQLQHRLPHLQRSLQDGGRLEHHQHLKHATDALRFPVCCWSWTSCWTHPWASCVLLIMNYQLDSVRVLSLSLENHSDVVALLSTPSPPWILCRSIQFTSPG